MKNISCAGAMVCVLSSSAMAAQVEWRGAVCVTTVNAICIADGWTVGTCMGLRFLPPNVGDNGVRTRLTFIGQTGASQFTLSSGNLLDTLFKPVLETVAARGGFQSTAPMRLSSLTPAAITATTPGITLAGVIQDTDGTPGCTLGFRGSATLKP